MRHLFLGLLLCSGLFALEIDDLFTAYDQPNVPGAAVTVIQDGEPVIERTYGLQNLEEAIPTSRYTNYRLASVSKAFTAMANLILIEAGELDLLKEALDAGAGSDFATGMVIGMAVG